jgi:hypothetical protein
VKYNKEFYDKEIEDTENEEDTLNEEIDLEDMLNEPNYKDANYETTEDNEGSDIGEYGEDYYDGVYYSEDRDPDDRMD